MDSNINRNYILGVAITMVIIYHAMDWIYNPIGRFNIGFIGVDIFLFFSGYGLTFSFENNSIKEFYKRRFFKIYPLFLIVSLFTIFITTTQYTPIYNFVFDSILKITTITYYVDVKNSTDWYLNSLFSFYLLFPLFYKLIKKYGFEFYLLLVFICVSVHVFGIFELHWEHDCFFSRIPIFCLGIVFATSHIKNDIVFKFSRWNLILAIPLYFYISKFLFFSFFAPYLICILKKISIRIKSPALEFLGKHSLEIYCANFIPYRFLYLADSIPSKFLLYFALQAMASFCFIIINKCIQKIFKF